jgi:lysophospholipase L1-like esterase
MWVPSKAVLVGQYMVVVTGSGATAAGNWFVCTTAGTTASTGGGPAGTGTGITDGTAVWSFYQTHPTYVFANASAVNSYVWNGGAGRAGATGPITYYGGIPTTVVSTGAVGLIANTFLGLPGVSVNQRIRFSTDSQYLVIRDFAVSAALPLRFIIDGRYASFTAVSHPLAGWGYVLLDFSGVGGQVTRDITIEASSGLWTFGGLDVSITESVNRVDMPSPLTAVFSGDSITESAGADYTSDGFGAILCDYLGIQNFIPTGISSCGYLVTSGAGAAPPAGSGTALSRISDVLALTAAYPNSIVVDENGQNDVKGGFTAAQIQAACIAYMRALRSGGFRGPIIELGIFPESQGGTNWAAGVAGEAAKLAAVAAMNDPLVFFVPLMQAPGGAVMTGTGNDVTPAGDGTADVYMNGNNLPHMNTAGYRRFALQLLSPITTILLSASN